MFSLFSTPYLVDVKIAAQDRQEDNPKQGLPEILHPLLLFLVYTPIPAMITKEGITITGIQKIILPWVVVKTTGVFSGLRRLTEISSPSSARQFMLLRKRSPFPARLICVLLAKSESPKTTTFAYFFELAVIDKGSCCSCCCASAASSANLTAATAAGGTGPAVSFPSSY